MDPRNMAIICFVGLCVAFALFMTSFIATYWLNTDLIHSGVWKSCVKSTSICIDNVEALELVGKAGKCRSSQKKKSLL